MLKNKKAVYILLPLNFLIWGFFIYRFFSLYEPGEEIVPSATQSMVKAETTENNVNYIPGLNYKDPFLKDVRIVRQQTGSHKVSPSPGIPKEKPKISPPVPVKKELPEIKYFGLIKNSDKGVSTALVSFNGRPVLIKPNDVIEGIAFKQFNKDSLLAKCGKENIVVRR